MQAVIYIFQCPKGRVYAGWRGVSPEALRTWPNRGSGPLPCGYTGSGNPWWRIARRHKAALVWRILARVDGTRADVDAAEVRAIRLTRAVFGQRCVNVLSGGQGLSSADARAFWADPTYADKTRAASAEAQRKPEVKAKQVVVQQKAQNHPEVKAKHCEASNRPEVKARRSAAQRLAQNRPEVKAKQSASQKAVHARPEVKARYAEANNNPLVKLRRSASQKEAQNRDVVRTKKVLANNRPGERQQRSAQGKARIQTPEGAATLARAQTVAARKGRARKVLSPFRRPPALQSPGVTVWHAPCGSPLGIAGPGRN